MFGKFSEANYLARGSIESVNHLWTANHNIIYMVHIYVVLAIWQATVHITN